MLRQPKIFKMAIFDWIASLAGAIVIGHYALGIGREIHIWILWIIFWILLGVFVHKAFGVRTPLGDYFGVY